MYNNLNVRSKFNLERNKTVSRITNNSRAGLESRETNKTEKTDQFTSRDINSRSTNKRTRNLKSKTAAQKDIDDEIVRTDLKNSLSKKQRFSSNTMSVNLTPSQLFEDFN